MTWRARNAGLVRALSLKATLESGRRWTLAQLAERFGVTTRTVRRDIAALEQAGVPVCCERGRHGDHFAPVQYWALS